MKKTFRNTLITTAALILTTGLCTTPVQAEVTKGASLYTATITNTPQEKQEYENYLNNALASMNLDGKSWKEKADAITDYVNWNFRYDAKNSSAYNMFRTGGGDCWAASDMIVALAQKAGFAATPRNDNISPGAGAGHRDALLQDPDGNVYACEAGYVRDQHEIGGLARQIGSADKLAFDFQPYQIYTYANGTKTPSGTYSDEHIIGPIYNFHNEVISLPTDASITALGYDINLIVNDNNSDPTKPQIGKDGNGNWAADATIGTDQPYMNESYYDPFELFDNLKTVKVGNNITHISNTALKGTDLNETRRIRFEISPDNPVYESTPEGGIRLKTDNDQGKAGSVIYVPLPDSGGTAKRSDGTVVMYRAYNPNSGEHFYTCNTKEFNHIVSLGWRNEGYGWIAPESSGSPVYRLYNRNGGEHHYTMSEKEKNALVKAGWKDEGIGWYSDDQKRTPLYRQYNPNAFANNHNYTTSDKEKNYLVSIGWRDEGIGWYGVSAN